MLNDGAEDFAGHGAVATRHFLRSKQYDRAIRSAQSMLAGQPDSAEGHMLLLEALLETKDWRKAQGEAAELLRVAPANPDAHYLVARFHSLQRRNPEAIAHLGECLRRAPHDPNAWSLLAATHEAMGQRGPAVAAAREAVRWAPHHPDFLAFLAILEMPAIPTRTQAKFLITRLMDVLAIDPENNYTWDRLAWIYAYSLGDWPAVVEATSIALAKDPSDPAKQRLLRDASMRQFWSYRVWSAPFRAIQWTAHNSHFSVKGISVLDGLRLLFLLLYGGWAVLTAIAFTYFTWWWPANFLSQRLILRGAPALAPARVREKSAWARRGLNAAITLLWLGPPVLLVAVWYTYPPYAEAAGWLAVIWGFVYLLIGLLTMVRLAGTFGDDWMQRWKEQRAMRRRKPAKPGKLPPVLK